MVARRSDKVTGEVKAVDGEDPEAVTPKVVSFAVAPGRAITCRRGILANCEEIRARDLADGELGHECLVELVETGHVVRIEA